MVRYADNFVVFCRTKKAAGDLYQLLEKPLRKRGLSLRPDRTKVTALTEGFDFLGFNIKYRPRFGTGHVLTHLFGED
jgi:RNA-directed DNA polymerase